MPCNAWNHALDCNCGFIGQPRYSRGDDFQHLRRLGAYPSRGLVSQYHDFTHSTICPKCGVSCFFIRHNGGCVWVDELGPPWPRHACFLATGHVPLSTEPRCINLSLEHPNQDLELLLDYASTRDGYSLVVLGENNPSSSFCGMTIPSLDHTDTPRLSHRPQVTGKMVPQSNTLPARLKERLRFEPVAITAHFPDGSSTEFRVTSIAYRFLLGRLTMISFIRKMLATVVVEIRPIDYAAYLNCHAERQPFYQRLLSGRPLSDLEKRELERLEQLALDLSSSTCTILRDCLKTT